jgi:hypothetical protein
MMLWRKPGTGHNARSPCDARDCRTNVMRARWDEKMMMHVSGVGGLIQELCYAIALGILE